MSCSLIFLDQTMCHGSINNGNRRLIGVRCGRIVTGIHRRDRLLDCCSQCRPLAGVMSPASFILSSPFPGLSCVCHWIAAWSEKIRRGLCRLAVGLSMISLEFGRICLRSYEMMKVVVVPAR